MVNWPAAFTSTQYLYVFVVLVICLSDVLSESLDTPASILLHVLWILAAAILNWISNRSTEQFQSGYSFYGFYCEKLELSCSTVFLIIWSLLNQLTHKCVEVWSQATYLSLFISSRERIIWPPGEPHIIGCLVQNASICSITQVLIRKMQPVAFSLIAIC